MKLFSYLATGRVIVAPIAPDTRELLGEHNALLVPPGDPVSAVSAMRAAVRDTVRWERIARAARATSAGLTWDARAQRIETALERWSTLAPTSRDEGGVWSASDWAGRTARWLLRRAASRA
jgi:glycosyltransferase involved in cell wall biosynthesis